LDNDEMDCQNPIKANSDLALSNSNFSEYECTCRAIFEERLNIKDRLGKEEIKVLFEI